VKRSELNVGDELYHAKPYEWTHDLTGRQVVVLSVEPVKRRDWGHRGIMPAVKSGGVHVRVITPGFTDWEDVVRLQDLRGPYDATLTEVKARQKRNQEQAREDEERAAARVARTDAVVARARAKGATSAKRNYASPGRVTIDAEELAALLDRLHSAECRATHGAA
jgi:pyruvate-formate lyase-activating enzyme